MMKKREIVKRRRKVSREMILKKGAEIFSEKGFFKTKIEDITRALSIGKGTFYLYFKNKDDLLKEIILNLHKDIYSINKKFLESKLNWNLKFKGLIRESLNFIKEKITFIRVFVQERILTGASFNKKKTDISKIFSFYFENQKILKSFFKEGINRKFLSNFYNPEELALFFDFLLRSRITKYVFSGKNLNLRKEEDIIYKFFIEGAGR